MDYNKISLIFSSISLILSTVLTINQIRLNNESKFKLSIIISKERSSFIDPIVTDKGNETSLLISVRFVNKSVVPIEISNLQNVICKNKFACLSNSKDVNKQYSVEYSNHVETIIPKQEGLEFPLKIEPYSSVEGIVVFPYAEKDRTKNKIEIQTPRKNIKKSLVLPTNQFE